MTNYSCPRGNKCPGEGCKGKIVDTKMMTQVDASRVKPAGAAPVAASAAAGIEKKKAQAQAQAPAPAPHKVKPTITTSVLAKSKGNFDAYGPYARSTSLNPSTAAPSAKKPAADRPWLNDGVRPPSSDSDAPVGLGLVEPPAAALPEAQQPESAFDGGFEVVGKRKRTALTVSPPTGTVQVRENVTVSANGSWPVAANPLPAATGGSGERKASAAKAFKLSEAEFPAAGGAGPSAAARAQKATTTTSGLGVKSEWGVGLSLSGAAPARPSVASQPHTQPQALVQATAAAPPLAPAPASVPVAAPPAAFPFPPEFQERAGNAALKYDALLVAAVLEGRNDVITGLAAAWSTFQMRRTSIKDNIAAFNGRPDLLSFALNATVDKFTTELEVQAAQLVMGSLSLAAENGSNAVSPTATVNPAAAVPQIISAELGPKGPAGATAHAGPSTAPATPAECPSSPALPSSPSTRSPRRSSPRLCKICRTQDAVYMTSACAHFTACEGCAKFLGATYTCCAEPLGAGACGKGVSLGGVFRVY